MKKIVLGVIVGMILLGLVIQPAAATVSGAPMTDTVPLAIHEGVTKTVSYWWGFDVYLSRQ